MRVYWTASNAVSLVLLGCMVVTHLAPDGWFSSGGMFGSMGKGLTLFFMACALLPLSINLAVAAGLCLARKTIGRAELGWASAVGLTSMTTRGGHDTGAARVTERAAATGHASESGDHAT